MSAGLIATKVGMSRVFTESGDAVPVTYLKVEPNTVVRCKTEDKDGYNAVVLGVGAKTWRSRKGKEHVKYRVQKEWQVEDTSALQPGSQITAAVFPEEATVTVTGVSKGRGFQGVIKRHGFSRGPETHGSHHHRRPGSVGMCEFPGRILKGKKMPGRMGNDQVTLRARAVLVTDAENGVVAIKGPIPGPNGATVYLTFEFEPDLSAVSGGQEVKEEKVEDVKEEEKAEAPVVEEVKEEKAEEKVEEVKEEDKVKDEEKDKVKEEDKTETDESPDSPNT